MADELIANPVASDIGAGSREDAQLDGQRTRNEEAPSDRHLWNGDAGLLAASARAALLQLVRGPYILEDRDADAWRALAANRGDIESRLADLFLDLVIDEEAGVAFARNVKTDDPAQTFPKAARSYPLTLLDTVMILTLRRELLAGGSGRVFIGQDELFEALEQYRNLEKQDPASFNARLKSAWNRLADARVLLKSDVEGRFEISPILKIIFGADEARAVGEALAAMRGAELEETADPEENDGKR